MYSVHVMLRICTWFLVPCDWFYSTTMGIIITSFLFVNKNFFIPLIGFYVFSFLSASMVLSFFIFPEAYSMVTNTTINTDTEAMTMLYHGMEKGTLNALLVTLYTANVIGIDNGIPISTLFKP